MTSTAATNDILSRLDRLESLEQIRQLPAKYALAVDMRDLDALVNLFVDDVAVAGGGRGRAALKAWYDRLLRRPGGSAHCVAGHVIDLEGTELASGLAYSRNELDGGSVWVYELLAYLDRYERREGRWYFQRRTPLFWYETDSREPPLGELKVHWPGSQPYAGTFHDAFPSWRAFWDAVDAGGSADSRPVPPPAPLHRFLTQMRGDAPVPRVNIGGSVPD